MRALCIAVAAAWRKSNASLVSAWINCRTVLRMSNINSVQYPARRLSAANVPKFTTAERLERKPAAIRLLLYAAQDLILCIYTVAFRL